MDELQHHLHTINKTTLTPIVRKALNNNTAEVTTWSSKPIYGGAGLIANIYRFSGTANVQSQNVPWSLILKASRSEAGATDPASTLYWQREALAYESGFLERLEGDLVSPRCFAIERPAAEKVWLWLDEVKDIYEAGWPLERYEVAARHLGAFNGRYLAQEAAPTAPWLSHHWLRAYLAQTAPVMANLAEFLHHPLAQRFYPPQIAHAYMQLWQKREELLDALDRLPQTLCHRDAYRRNLFARRNQQGEEQTVAIDWAEVGDGALGEELVPLIVATAIFFEIDSADLQHLDQIAFSGYLAGLREAGWMGPANVVRLGYTAAAALRFGLGLIQFLPNFLDESQRDFFEKTFVHTREEMADDWIPIHHYLLALATEAQGLMHSVHHNT
jgi:hypothetical protein